MKIDLSNPSLVTQGAFVFKFQSESREGKFHYVIVSKDTKLCTCEGFQFTSNCRHLDKISNAVGKAVDGLVKAMEAWQEINQQESPLPAEE